MEKFIQLLERSLAEYRIEYRIHSTRRMFRRNIDNTDVEYILQHGDVIERYNTDFPFPSVLINEKPHKIAHCMLSSDSITLNIFL